MPKKAAGAGGGGGGGSSGGGGGANDGEASIALVGVQSEYPKYSEEKSGLGGLGARAHNVGYRYVETATRYPAKKDAAESSSRPSMINLYGLTRKARRRSTQKEFLILIVEKSHLSQATFERLVGKAHDSQTRQRHVKV